MDTQHLRHLDQTIQKHFQKYQEVLILLGSRQTGKTTLIKKIFPDAIYFLLDNEPVRKAFESYDINTYRSMLPPLPQTIILDEVHLLSNPGRAIKILYDQIPDIKLIITGSSAFHLKNKTSESLAGRKIDYFLYPLTFSEYLVQNKITAVLDFNVFNNLLQNKIAPKSVHLFDLSSILNSVLLFGLYPAMVNHPCDKLYLENFVDSLIFKDILELGLIDNRRLGLNLLRLLAHQIGNLINYSELANQLQADQRTVKRYIDIFEQSFIIFRLSPFSGNKRSEIVKSPKIYFYDTGIRNALISNFSDIDTRTDKGALFENFIIAEALKANNIQQTDLKLNFWRTKQGAEVDLVLSNEKQVTGVEIKYAKGLAHHAFTNHFPQAQYHSITAENFY